MSLIPALAAGAGMGLVISALGAGGSLFIIPVLVYLFHEPVTRATGTSLTVVFAAALIGAIGHGRQGHVRARIALVFGSASVLGALAGAVLHARVSSGVILFLLSVTLLCAAALMLVPRRGPVGGASGGGTPWHTAPTGLLVGILTGFLGVGGGFVIVPVLVWSAGLGLREAIGTSLAIIALSSAAGALGHVIQGNVSASLALVVGAGAIAGALAGAPLSGRLPDRPLRVAFAILTTATALYMMSQTAPTGLAH